MIRPTIPEDTPTLLTLTQTTGVFKDIEVEALEEVLNDYHAENHKHGHRSVTYEDKGQVIGFAYFAPAAMTDRTWYLYWIAVSKQTQAKGDGGGQLARPRSERDVERRLHRHRGPVPHADEVAGQGAGRAHHRRLRRLGRGAGRGPQARRPPGGRDQALPGTARPQGRGRRP